MKKGPIPRSSGIYLITNTKTRQVYVGSAVDLLHRWSLHKWALRNNRHHNPRLQAAWKKYGEGAFTFTILEPVSEKNLLLAAEQKWLDSYRAGLSRQSYNFLTVAGSHLGRKRSAATVRRLKKAAAGRIPSRETVEASVAVRKGKRLSPEHRAKVAESVRGRRLGPMSEERKQFYRKLRPEQVHELKLLKETGYPVRELAGKFRVGISTIWRIQREESYVGV
jgi:group I intron endonuclease